MKKPSLNFITNAFGTIFGGGLALDALLTPENIATALQLAGSADPRQLAIAAAVWVTLYFVGKKEGGQVQAASEAPEIPVDPAS